MPVFLNWSGEINKQTHSWNRKANERFQLIKHFGQ